MKEIIREITMQKSTFVATDGKEFDNETDCRVHETKMTEAIEAVKRKKIFGERFEDAATLWAMGDGISWYAVKITSQEDLIDFLAIVRGHDENGTFDSKFVDEVMEIIESGNTFEMLLQESYDGYMYRFSSIFKPSSYCTAEKSRELYNNELKRIENLRKLADEMAKYVILVDDAEKDGETK